MLAYTHAHPLRSLPRVILGKPQVWSQWPSHPTTSNSPPPFAAALPLSTILGTTANNNFDILRAPSLRHTKATASATSTSSAPSAFISAKTTQPCPQRCRSRSGLSMHVTSKWHAKSRAEEHRELPRSGKILSAARLRRAALESFKVRILLQQRPLREK